MFVHTVPIVQGKGFFFTLLNFVRCAAVSTVISCVALLHSSDGVSCIACHCVVLVHASATRMPRFPRTTSEVRYVQILCLCAKVSAEVTSAI